MASNRIGRINEEVQRELAVLIPTVKDPRVTGMISVTAVDVTQDLKFAAVSDQAAGGDQEFKAGIAAVGCAHVL